MIFSLVRFCRKLTYSIENRPLAAKSESSEKTAKENPNGLLQLSRIKRRSFLLLELLIALTLVMLLSVYLIRNPMHQLKKEVEALVELEGERLWLVYLMEIRKKMPEEFESYQEKKGEWIFKNLTVVIPGDEENKPIVQKDVIKEYRRCWKAKHEDPNGTQYFRLRIELKKKSKNPIYDFFVAIPKK